MARANTIGTIDPPASLLRECIGALARGEAPLSDSDEAGFALANAGITTSDKAATLDIKLFVRILVTPARLQKCLNRMTRRLFHAVSTACAQPSSSSDLQPERLLNLLQYGAGQRPRLGRTTFERTPDFRAIPQQLG